MNKNELCNKVADAAGLPKASAQKAVDVVFEAISSALARDEEVRLVGFGTFLVTKRKETTGRNPQTGAILRIPATNQAKFRPGKALKEAVNA